MRGERLELPQRAPERRVAQPLWPQGGRHLERAPPRRDPPEEEGRTWQRPGSGCQHLLHGRYRACTSAGVAAVRLACSLACSFACFICQRRSEETLSAECRSTVCPVRTRKKVETLRATPREKLVKEPESFVEKIWSARCADHALRAQRVEKKKRRRRENVRSEALSGGTRDFPRARHERPKFARFQRGAHFEILGSPI